MAMLAAEAAVELVSEATTSGVPWEAAELAIAIAAMMVVAAVGAASHWYLAYAVKAWRCYLTAAVAAAAREAEVIGWEIAAPVLVLVPAAAMQ